jgi:hypothetical protein
MAFNLRSKLIRLAHQNPELRGHLLPLLKQAGTNDVLDFIIPQDDLGDVYNRLEKEDAQSAELLLSVYDAIRKRLELPHGEDEAVSRIRDLITRGKNWDVGLMRNNIFKAASLMGLKLPSHSF